MRFCYKVLSDRFYYTSFVNFCKDWRQRRYELPEMWNIQCIEIDFRRAVLIPAISAIGDTYDPEYAKILYELRRLGITPTGNKIIDKAKLKNAKIEEAENKLEQKICEKPNNNDKEREELEKVRTGAMTLAQINRILLNI